MNRRSFITVFSGAAAAWPLAAHAQTSKNIPRLCFLTFDPATSRSTRFDAFFQGLVDLGYVDGKTITIDYLSADGDGERFPSLAAECLRLKAIGNSRDDSETMLWTSTLRGVLRPCSGLARYVGAETMLWASDARCRDDSKTML